MSIIVEQIAHVEVVTCSILGRAKISGYKIGKIRKKYKWGSIEICSTIIDIY
jgi:hypothetical protein